MTDGRSRPNSRDSASNSRSRPMKPRPRNEIVALFMVRGVHWLESPPPLDEVRCYSL